MSDLEDHIENEEFSPAEGEIMLITDSEITYDFMEIFSKKIGYEYLGEWEHGVNIHILKVPVGKEEELIITLPREYPKFISGAQKRYPILDKRYEFTHNLKRRALDLEGYVEDVNFEKELENLITYMKNFKD